MVEDLGGATDLVVRLHRVVLVMEHASRGGRPGFMPTCSPPPLGMKMVDIIIDLEVPGRRKHPDPFQLVEGPPEMVVDDAGTKIGAHQVPVLPTP